MSCASLVSHFNVFLAYKQCIKQHALEGPQPGAPDICDNAGRLGAKRLFIPSSR